MTYSYCKLHKWPLNQTTLYLGLHLHKMGVGSQEGLFEGLLSGDAFCKMRQLIWKLYLYNLKPCNSSLHHERGKGIIILLQPPIIFFFFLKNLEKNVMNDVFGVGS